MEKEKCIIGQLDISDIQVNRVKKRTSIIIRETILNLAIIYGCLFILGVYITICAIGGFAAIQNGLFDILITTQIPNILRNAIFGILFALVVFVFIMMLWLNWMAVSNFCSSLGKTWIYTAQFKNIITNEYDTKQTISFEERKSASQEKLTAIIVRKIESKYNVSISISKANLPNE